MDYAAVLGFLLGNAISLAISLYVFARALTRTTRKAVAALLYAGSILALGASYVAVLGPWMKGALPLFTGNLTGFLLLLGVHTMIPALVWIAPAMAVYALVARAHHRSVE